MKKNFFRNSVFVVCVCLILLCILILKQKKEQELGLEPYVTAKEVRQELAFSVYAQSSWQQENLELHHKYLTWQEAKNLIRVLGLEDYVETGDKKTGKISREAWNPIYEAILDYLDSEKEISKRSILVLNRIDTENGSVLITDSGDYETSLPGTYFVPWKSYEIYEKDGNCLGAAGLWEQENRLLNVYLKMGDGMHLDFLFQGAEYTYKTDKNLAENVEGVCDLIFQGQELSAIRRKEEQIQGKLLSYDETAIEIEGYGKITHRGKLPVYQIAEDGTVKESSITSVVLGNMDVTYITGDGEVCAILSRNPAVMEKIRVLLTDASGQRYHNTIYLKADRDGVIRTGSQEKSYQAHSVYSPAGDMTGDETVSLELLDGDGLIWLCDENGVELSRGYRGRIEVRNADGGYTAVNELPIEDYLKAVVPSEMPASYEMEALKAQAVCARSYAYIQLLRSDLASYGAHVDDSTAYQVYNKSEQNSRTTQAVEETTGQILMYQGSPAEAYYFSTSMGYTESMEVWNLKDAEGYDYLQTVCLNEGENTEDLSSEEAFKSYIVEKKNSYDSDVRYTRWRAFADFKQNTQKILEILKNGNSISKGNVLYYDSDGKTEVESLSDPGSVTDISVEERSRAGFILTLKITCEHAVIKVKNENLIRRVLGAGVTEITYADESRAVVTMLPSAACTVEKQADGSYLLYGGGFGHGIGMSQNGANGMARAGKNYEEILHFFYQNVEIGGMN